MQVRSKCPPKRPPRGTTSAFPILIHSVPPVEVLLSFNFFFEKIPLFYVSADCNLLQFVYKLDPVFFTTNCLLRRLFVCLEQRYKLSTAIASIAITCFVYDKSIQIQFLISANLPHMGVDTCKNV